MVKYLLVGLVVDNTQVALDKVEYAWYVEIEPETYQDVLLDIKQLFMVNQVFLFKQLGDVS